MPQSYAVALPNGSEANYDIGLANRVWGWKDSALDQHNSDEGRLRRSIAENIRVGDQLVLAIGTPGRTPSWDTATLRRLVIADVTRSLYRTDDEVWPDELYPNRIDIAVVEEWENVNIVRVGVPAMRALRWSFHSQGSPCTIPGITDVRLEAPPSPDELDQAERDLVASGLLSEMGDLDATSVARRRREQATLRRRLFAGRSLVPCALCGRALPPSLLRAAHIKRRADATDIERRNLSNLMAACVLGCDDLFERGFLTIDADGTVVGTDTTVEALSRFINALQGRRADIDLVASQHFLAWHREHHGRSS